jgi:glycosyltransferase involved in cell wall biosynthesis
MAGPTVGLALIVHNEEDHLPQLLDSIEGAFDHIALVDNDSTDDTIELFQAWCARTDQPHTIDNVAWRYDFSAKRNHAQGLLETDWIAWADADDTIEGAHNLKWLAERAPDDLAGYLITYDYLFTPHGECILTFPRERLVRRGAGYWTGRPYDAQIIAGDVTYAPPDVAYWTHHGMDHVNAQTDRDRRILERWHRDEPDNQLVVNALKAHDLYPKYFDLALSIAVEDERERIARARGLSSPRYNIVELP